MPRAIMLYRMPLTLLRKYSAEDLASRIEGARLMELKRYFEEEGDKLGLRRMEALSKVVPGLELTFVRLTTSPSRVHMLLRYKYSIKISYISRGERKVKFSNVDVESDVDFRLRSGLLALYDIPLRRLARAVCELISLKLFGNVSSITPLVLEREHLTMLESWLKSEEYSVKGTIIRVTFTRPLLNGVRVEELTVKREALDQTDLYMSMKNSADKIKAVTFVTPLLEEIQKKVTCRIDSRGGLLIYTPNLRSADIDVLLSYLEKALGLISR